MLPLRSLANRKSNDSRPRESPSANFEVASRYNDESSNWSTDDEEEEEDEDDEENDEDKVLLVRPTISRDTTQNTTTVDSVDLSKIAAHTDDLPLNRRDLVSEGLSPEPLNRPAPPHIITPPEPLLLPPLPVPPPLAVPPTSILAKIRSGTDLATLYRETWAVRPHFASYNWHDKLRIIGRRKSESNLDTYRETGNDSWIFQYLPPNASKRRLVETWKLWGHGIEQKKEGALSQRTGGYSGPNSGKTPST